MALRVAWLRRTMGPVYRVAPAAPGTGSFPSRVYQISAPDVAVVRRTTRESRPARPVGSATGFFAWGGGSGGPLRQFTTSLRLSTAQLAVSQAMISKTLVPSTKVT